MVAGGLVLRDRKGSRGWEGALRLFKHRSDGSQSRTREQESRDTTFNLISQLSEIGNKMSIEL